MGQSLMPWQRLVADVIGEVDEEGMPAYREVIFSTPRQSGKTILQLAAIEQRARGWADLLGEPQRILYSAQTGNDARKKLVDDWCEILEPRKGLLGIRTINKGMGNERVAWRNRSLMVLMGSSSSSGHGKTLDLALKDELFHDQDGRRDQALIPAMATRPFGQMLTASTMGTPLSVAWNAKVGLGRAAVEAGERDGVAYFEWSADPTADPESPDTWAACMPALGYTQSVKTIRASLKSMLAAPGVSRGVAMGEFKRAFLNIPTVALEQIIPAPAWAQVCSPLTEATAVVFALDVNPDRTRASIVAAGGRTVEVVDVRTGTGWVLERCIELYARYNVPIVVAATGPAAAFVTDLTDARVPVVEVSGRDETRAAQGFLDAVLNGTVEVKSDTDLDDAVAAATKRPVGDAWAWGRKNSQRDISPLVAASIGLFQASQVDKTGPVFAY